MNFITPKIAIYTGKGSSYSWIWLAEIFDKFSIANIHFINSIENLDCYDILVLPGGDTFALAEGIGKEKLQQIKNAIENGLTYFGICAGAYLPLKSALTPLSWFNLVNAKISNISSNIDNFDKNYIVPYGCSFVLHPIRDEVVVKIKDKELKVPLFGGPIIKECEDEIIASYENFTDRTVFLTTKHLAEKIIIGKIAVIKKNYGNGRLYLFSPHFEHPNYDSANKFFIEKIYEASFTKHKEPKIPKEENFCISKELKRELSNARLLANSLDNINWKIGIKNWDAEKANYFLVSILKRIKNIKKIEEECLENAKKIVEILREIKKNTKEGKDTTILADEMLILLSKTASSFFNSYFREKCN